MTTNLTESEGLRETGCITQCISYFYVNVTLRQYNPLPQMRLWWLSHNSITITSNMQKCHYQMWVELGFVYLLSADLIWCVDSYE